VTAREASWNVRTVKCTALNSHVTLTVEFDFVAAAGWR
jgi:hypothetical protein